MDLKQAMAARHSVRAYAAKQLDEAALDAILRAGCAGPVGMGRYENLHITVVQDAGKIARISQATQKVTGSQDDPLYGPPAYILLSARAEVDAGISFVNAAGVMQNMALAAAEQGAGSVIIWASSQGIEQDAQLKAALGIPAGYKAVLGASFGYPAQADSTRKDMGMTSSVNRV